VISVELQRKTSQPPGRRSRAASGIQRSGSHQDARAVLGEREVEGRVRQRHVLGACLDEREVEAELGLHRPRGVELRGRDVDATGRAPRARQPGEK
jgi:hypothetical protein